MNLTPTPTSQAKLVAIKQEFNLEIINKINEIENKLINIKEINTQADVDTANAILKESKALIKLGSEERMSITRVLDTEKDRWISYEKTLFSPISSLTATINNKIISFQTAKLKKDQEEKEKIEREKQSAINAANVDAARVLSIKTQLVEFERNVVAAISACANEKDVREKRNMLAEFEMTREVYEEFTLDAVMLKSELIKKIDSGELRAGKVSDIAQALDLKVTAIHDEAMNAAMSNAANIQMEAELKQSMIPAAKGVSKTWTFDEENIDMSILPREYCTFDKAKIKKFIAEGGRKIDGVNIFQKVNNVSR